jgi:hypothetical protein
MRAASSVLHDQNQPVPHGNRFTTQTLHRGNTIMAWFKYIGGDGDHSPNGNFNFRGKNFDIDGTPKELTDPEAIAKARAMSTFEEVPAPGGLALASSDDEIDAEAKKTGRKSKRGE